MMTLFPQYVPIVVLYSNSNSNPTSTLSSMVEVLLPIQPLLVSYYSNLCLGLYSEIPKFLLSKVLVYKSSRYIIFC